MKKNSNLVMSFAIKNAIISIVVLIITCVIMSFFSILKIQNQLVTMVESKILDAANALATLSDGSIIDNFQPGDENTPEYNNLLRKARKIRDDTGITYLYIFKNDGTGKSIFVLDTDEEVPEPIGDLYEAQNQYIDMAWNGTSSVTKENVTTSWGTFRVAYAPIYDDDGKITCLVGADYEISWIKKEERAELISYILMCALILGVLIIIFAFTIVINYKKIKQELLNILTQIKFYSNNISEAIKKFESDSVELAESYNISANAISEISTTLSETSSMIKMNDDDTAKAAEYFKAASEEMSEVTNEVHSLVECIKDIEKTSDEITSIVNEITNIANQTTILSINAQIEAARVGEQGKGFTVVAQEVGTLANKVEAAASSSERAIQENFTVTQRAVLDTKNISEVIKSINQKITNLSLTVDKLAHTSIDQRKGTDQILKSVSTIENLITQNMSFINEVRSQAGDLLDMTLILNNQVDSIESV